MKSFHCKIAKFLRTMIILSLLLLAGGCYTTRYAPGANGVVVDGDTGRTIRGARVTRLEIKAEPLHSSVAVASATTNQPVQMRWPPIPSEGIPEEAVVADDRGQFSLPSAGRTQIRFLYEPNSTAVSGSFLVTAPGYHTNIVEGFAGPKTFWRVNLGEVRLKKL